MRRRAVADIVVGVALVRLVQVRCGSQAIERVVTVIMGSCTIDHLRDVVDRVELIFEISQVLLLSHSWLYKGSYEVKPKKKHS
jgi:hypothetical protein